MTREVGRFLELDRVIRKIAQDLTDVEHSDPKIRESARKICKLLYYTEKNPLEQPTDERKNRDPVVPCPEFITLTEAKTYIIDKRLKLVPQVPAEEERGAFIVVILDGFNLSENKQFKVNRIVFDVLCHEDDWLLDNSLRPYLIMQQIDNIFNNKKLSIGKVEFDSARSVVLSSTLLGYNMVYKDASFN